ncbi:hypothetical protein N1851_024704 [Merluccius polli]|uniref:Alkylated DNA repair protein AlkB homologue 8 N-terminal domain-containing protein n=1 Tax=Merluccius polli TaxID=89951 RepID=A0AA47MEU4_MERPO|nr:hypothetical protein N1851_024704 [Merluccius polli]
MFCESETIPIKTIRIFPNNKLWITSDLKGYINEKKRAFLNENTELVREKRCELRSKLRKARIEYKDKLGATFSAKILCEYGPWCLTSFLEINVSKTKELVFQKDIGAIQPITVLGQHSTYADAKLIFREITDFIFKKCSQRLYLIRKLNNFGVNQEILQTVYKSLVESVLSFNMIMWYGNLNIQRRNKLQRTVNMASKIIGKPQRHLSSLYEEQSRNKADKIISDPSHPLHREFELLPSRRHFRVPSANSKQKYF